MELPIDKRNNVVNLFYQNLPNFSYNNNNIYVFGIDRYTCGDLEIISTYNSSNRSRCIKFMLPLSIESTYHAEYYKSEVLITYSTVPVLMYDDLNSELFIYNLDDSGINYNLPHYNPRNNKNDINVHGRYDKSIKFDLEMKEDVYFQSSTVTEPFIDYEEFKKLQEIIKSVQSSVIYETIGKDNIIRYQLTTKLSKGA